MPIYRNLGGNSGVASYEFGSDWIEVTFTTGKVYRYTYASVGAENLEHMKALAEQGQGLNSFISSNPAVRKGYETHW
ncbi:MAG: hypothetical protein VX620_06865 [Pseudomonadota bacterium]|nr:hypothetical protein [Pseudomonadota bacterium]